MFLRHKSVSRLHSDKSTECIVTLTLLHGCIAALLRKIHLDFLYSIVYIAIILHHPVELIDCMLDFHGSLKTFCKWNIYGITFAILKKNRKIICQKLT